ncbi:MAG: hypothetical protein ABIJ18_00250 [archaeon]
MVQKSCRCIVSNNFNHNIINLNNDHDFKGYTMKINEIIYKASNISFYVLIIIAIIMIIIKLTGHSPTMDQIILTIVSAMFIVVIKNQYDLGKSKGEASGIKRELNLLNKKVDSIGQDLKKHLSN